jgi:hypothetical protein
MRKLLGYFLIAQAVITGVIVYSINNLANSQTGGSKQLIRGSDLGMPTIAFILLIVAGIGIFLIVRDMDRR